MGAGRNKSISSASPETPDGTGVYTVPSVDSIDAPNGAASKIFVPRDRYDLQVLQSLRRIMRATDLYSRKVANEHQLTVPQLLCLLTVEQNEPVTVTAIAREVHLSASTVVGIVDRLCAKDLVVRERDSEDRRVVNIMLLERGREVTARAPSPLQDRFLSAFEKLPKVEQENIAISLQRVVDLMEAEDLDAAPVLIAQPPHLMEPDASLPGK